MLASITHTGGVHLAVENNSKGLELHVSDTGIGITPEDRERLFEEFYQVGNANRDSRKGFGLGLAIARRLATQLGGDVHPVGHERVRVHALGFVQRRQHHRPALWHSSTGRADDHVPTGLSHVVCRKLHAVGCDRVRHCVVAFGSPLN